MHVGLNLVYLVPGEIGGMDVYARELIRGLLAERPDVRLTAFVNREAAAAGDGPWASDIAAVTVPVRARNRLEWVRGEQQLLPPLAARAGADLVHSLASTAPAWGRFARVVTIHDITYRMHWRAHGLLSAGMAVLVPLAAHRSDRVIAISRNTRDDLVAHLRVRPAKIDVVPQGVGQAPSEPAPADELRARYGIDARPLVLTLSAKRAHKNLARLIEALALIPAERRPLLVMPGYRTPHEDELRELASRLRLERDTRFPGWVGAAEVEGLYALASCFVYPSLYEGFGLPVLEAMVRGVPVACTARGSLAEVAGDAALLFDPESPRSIAAAIERLLSDRNLRERLVDAGHRQAARFSWAQTARLTAAAYERALAQR